MYHLLPAKNVITATAENNDEYYYNVALDIFINSYKVDIWANDHFTATKENIPAAIKANKKHSTPLKDIRLREVEM